ncbi:glyoxylate reductase (NADP(+)) [Ensifer sp. ENS06]|uniref:NAD(P)-dependent oxidoreductase n=1 Tax=Ensifer sp. ENS06 TaxID=2769276 RepID=UPI00177B9430|nr:NAD(P)-dependent oxidoreductase [Ensifer sp. ENS06]MBD9626989.1 glyoxylate reductase (NADP(+)) [Ensifer sp. ENS06]
MRQNPVIINQVSAKFGSAVARHCSAPVVLDHIQPDRPWDLPEGAEILVTNASAWRNCPPDFSLPPKLKWVQTEATGVEIYPEVLKSGCIMTCGRGLNAAPIAEFVFAALLRREKKLEEIRAYGPADWNRPEIGGLYGRTLGIIGFGALGEAIARRASAFCMNIVAYRRGSWNEVPERVTPCFSPEAVITRADYLVIAAPFTSETAGMFNAVLLSQAKPGLHLINISRGGLVDQQALLDGLDSGRIGYATLDVTSPEPLPDGHSLYSHPNVFISPHISWLGSKKGNYFLDRFLSNLDAYLCNQPLRHLVHPEHGY